MDAGGQNKITADKPVGYVPKLPPVQLENREVTRGAGFLACQQPWKAAPRRLLPRCRKSLRPLRSFTPI
jgi:hypothetical protein